jgi:hypothetical protein
MTQTALTPAEREHFLEHGYVLLKGAFSREFALNEVRKQFAANGMDAQRPETWREPRMSLPATKSFSTAEIAPRMWAAACEILGGVDRIAEGEVMYNAMIACCFMGEGEPWAAPDENGGWHKDGQFFRHFLDSPEQALLGIPLWSDVVPQGGGTFIAPESIGQVARFLADHPEGVHPLEFPTADLMRRCKVRREAVGEAGDYYLMHGTMLHSVSPNPRRKLRAISNTIFALKEPLQFDRENPDEYSLLEQVVLRGLGVDRYDFRPTRERCRTPDHSVLPKSLV